MQSPIHPKAARTVRLAASAAALATAVGIAAAPGNAAPPVETGVASFKEPKLSHGRLTVKGTPGSDTIALRLQAGTPTLQVDVGDDGSAEFSFELAAVREIDVEARAGDDVVRIDESNGLFTTVIPTRIDGGPGDDAIAGGQGVETLLGGHGNDTIDGNRGNDLAFMGVGDDTFVWDPGDGSDTIEGQQGADTMRFVGADIGERVDLSANGNRLRFVRDIAGITMDTRGVERVDFIALGGPDVVTVNDLTRTGVDQVNVDLAGAAGGGDTQADQIVVNATTGADAINVSEDASRVVLAGLPALVAIQHQEGASDALAVNGLGGNDAISAATLAAQTIALTLDGGPGDDTIAGSQGVETLLGGDGNDSIDGNRGNDPAVMGAGDDTFVWDPGDGSDTIEGEEGADTMRFVGANSERVDLSANGNRLRFFRDVGTVTMDTAGVERVDFIALGGADVVTVNDLSGTDVETVNVDLAGAAGGGDTQPDQVTVNGTDGNDAIAVSGSNGTASVVGLAATVNLTNAEPANDTLAIAALGGDDVVDASGLAATAIKLRVEGGDGADVLVGSAGDDALFGDAGDDVLTGGPGQDLLDGGPGDNVLIQD